MLVVRLFDSPEYVKHMLKVDSTTAIVQGTFFTYPMNTGVPGVRFHSPI